MDLDVKKDDILLVMSYADKDRNGIIDLEEFLSLFPDHKQHIFQDKSITYFIKTKNNNF